MKLRKDNQLALHSLLILASVARRSSVRNLVLENLIVNNDGNEMDEQYLGHNTPHVAYLR